MEKGQTQQELNEAQAHDADRWCYCQTDCSVSDIGNIMYVQDRFPFFFKSLHDAVCAALMEKENKDNDSIDTSFICDRDGTLSPGENSTT